MSLPFVPIDISSEVSLLPERTQLSFEDKDIYAHHKLNIIRGMNRSGNISMVIELHDSRVAGVSQHGSSVTVHFRPAYLHRSEGRAGIDPGSGWVQDIDLIFSDAFVSSHFFEVPQSISEGSLSAGSYHYGNTFPLPIDAEEGARLSAVGISGESLVVEGSGVKTMPQGEAHYVEDFPGIS